MRKSRMNGDNRKMKRAALTALIGSAVALAACGGSNNNASQAPTHKQKSNGGVVSAEPTKGILGPAVTVDEAGGTTTGKGGPISPKENRPTDAQNHGVAGSAACASTSANPDASNLGQMNAAILCLLNAERSAKGMQALHTNGKLGKAARAWANKMVAARFFAHESGSSTPLTRIKKTGYIKGVWTIGENIAWGSGSLATPRAIVNGWMHSPPHRANILHAAFRDIGLGIKIGAPGAGLTGGATYVTDFGKHS